MLGLGTTELIIILFIIILLFGGRRLPELATGLGKGIRNFKKASREPDAIDVTPPKEDAPDAARSKTDADKS